LAISDPDVRKAMHYIREHLQSQILQVSELAEALGLSRRTLERRFVKSLGHGPAHEIQKSRLKLAAKLLRETDMSISDIAARVGYSSSEYLMRVFKKDRGYTPSEFDPVPLQALLEPLIVYALHRGIMHTGSMRIEA
jgi:LacI family transcriptional regulator